MKPEAKEFLEQTKIEELLHKYSEFIQYPLAVWSSTTETVEEPIEEDLTAEETEKKADENDEEAKVEEEQEDSKPKTKSVEKTTWDYKVVNENKPIWTRSPKDVTDDEYNRFYKDFTKDTNVSDHVFCLSVIGLFSVLMYDCDCFLLHFIIIFFLPCSYSLSTSLPPVSLSRFFFLTLGPHCSHSLLC